MRSTRPTPDAHQRGSGETSDSPEPRFIAIGQIIRPHGVHGEVLVAVLTDFPERFDALQVVYLGDAQEADPWQVTAARWHRDQVLLKFQGCPDRTAAEQLRGWLVQIPVEETMPLPEGEYYVHQLIGLDVVTPEGEKLGQVSQVLFTNANEVYVVSGPRGEILLPAIADVIERIDLDAHQMQVRLIEGLV